MPVSVERRVERKPAAVTWWIDDVMMDEAERLKRVKEKTVPAQWRSTKTASYFHVLRVFDELIQNRDRNAGNLLWTRDGKLWMIDHTRAFRLGRAPESPSARSLRTHPVRRVAEAHRRRPDCRRWRHPPQDRGRGADGAARSPRQAVRRQDCQARRGGGALPSLENADATV